MGYLTKRWWPATIKSCTLQFDPRPDADERRYPNHQVPFIAARALLVLLHRHLMDRRRLAQANGRRKPPARAEELFQVRSKSVHEAVRIMNEADDRIETKRTKSTISTCLSGSQGCAPAPAWGSGRRLEAETWEACQVLRQADRRSVSTQSSTRRSECPSSHTTTWCSRTVGRCRSTSAGPRHRPLLRQESRSREPRSFWLVTIVVNECHATTSTTRLLCWEVLWAFKWRNIDIYRHRRYHNKLEGREARFGLTVGWRDRSITMLASVLGGA